MRVIFDILKVFITLVLIIVLILVGVYFVRPEIITNHPIYAKLKEDFGIQLPGDEPQVLGEKEEAGDNNQESTDGVDTIQTENMVEWSSENRLELSGKVGDGYSILMQLDKEGDTVTGSYINQGVGLAIPLNGNLQPDGSMVLFESTGNQASYFNGIFGKNKNASFYRGNWNVVSDNQIESFILYVDEGINYPTDLESLNQVYAKPTLIDIKTENYELNGLQPELVNVSASLSTQTTDFINSFYDTESIVQEFNNIASTIDARCELKEGCSAYSSADFSYQVTYNSGDVFSLRLEKEIFFAGQIRPEIAVSTINFVLSEGEQLNLQDMFAGKNEFLVGLRVKVLETLKNRDPELDIDPSDNILNREEDFANYNLTYKGLQFNFDRFQLGSNPQSVTVIVPFEDLEGFAFKDLNSVN